MAIYRTASGETVMAVCSLVPYAAEDVAAMRLVTSLTLVQAQLKRDVYKRQVLDRLKAYHEQTEPLVAFYRERGKLAVIPFCPSIEAVSYTHLAA